MIVRKAVAVFLVTAFTMVGCSTDERIARLEAKLQKLEAVNEFLIHYEPECGHAGKRQNVECHYRLTVTDVDKDAKNTAYGTMPDDVIAFHRTNCECHQAELPDKYPCPEPDDYKNVRWFFKIDTSKVDNGKTYNLINNKGERLLRLDDDQKPPVAPVCAVAR